MSKIIHVYLALAKIALFTHPNPSQEGLGWVLLKAQIMPVLSITLFCII